LPTAVEPFVPTKIAQDHRIDIGDAAEHVDTLDHVVLLSCDLHPAIAHLVDIGCDLLGRRDARQGDRLRDEQIARVLVE
jgi:hypothetical protein